MSLYSEYKGFYDDLSNELDAPGEASWQGIMSQYYGATAGSYGDARVVGEAQYTAVNAEQGMTAANIQLMIDWWMEHGLKQGPNTQVIVLTAPGTSFNEDPAKEILPGGEEELGCAYHGIDGQGYSFDFVPYAGDMDIYFSKHRTQKEIETGENGSCDIHQDGEAETTQLMWSSTAIASHEYAEAVTDPGYNGKYAWFSESGGEIADLCAHSPVDSVELPEKNGRPGWWYVTELWDDEGGNTCKLEDPPYPEPPPKVAAQTPRNVTRETAELAAQIDPEGLEASYVFDYGTSPSYGLVSGQGHLPAEEKWTNVYMPVSGLKSCTTYDFRVVAKTVFGEVDEPNQTLTTQCKPPNAETWGGYSVTRTAVTMEGEVMPNSVSTEYWFDYKEVGGAGRETSRQILPYIDESWHDVEVPVMSLKSCSVYEMTLLAKNSDGEKRANTEVFTTECWPPSVKSEPVHEIKRVGATFEGEVYPNGLPTKYWFEYGKKGSSGWTKTSVSEPPASTEWYPESAKIGSLEPCNEYQFRIVAENEDSWNGPPKGVVDGETEYFATRCKPVIKNVHVTHLEPGSVVLEAEVNPEEVEAGYHFEYDTREYRQGEVAHGTSVPVPEGSAGAGIALVKVNAALVKLIPGQTYYFQTVTHNVSGQTTSETSFKTPIDWESNGKPVTLSGAVKAEGSLVLEDRGMAVTAECVVKAEGKSGITGGGEVTKVTGSKGEGVVLCHLSKTGFCEGSSVEMEAVNLPWKTELVDEPVKNEKGEVLRYEVRNRFYGSVAPGLKWKCKDGSTVLSDSCVGEVSGNVEDVSSGVPVEFDAKSPHLTCSGSGSGTGSLEGALVFTSTEGSVLSVSGAPAGPVAPVVVTGAASNVTSSGATLSGTITAKGAETKSA